MKIYIAHSSGFDFRKELYEPIQNSSLLKEYTYIFPHIEIVEPFNSKELFQNGCDLIIAEVSHPSIGLGIELGWADILNVPIICIYKKNSKLSASLKVVTDTFIEYSSTEDLVSKLTNQIQDLLDH